MCLSINQQAKSIALSLDTALLLELISEGGPHSRPLAKVVMIDFVLNPAFWRQLEQGGSEQDGVGKAGKVLLSFGDGEGGEGGGRGAGGGVEGAQQDGHLSRLASNSFWSRSACFLSAADHVSGKVSLATIAASTDFCISRSSSCRIWRKPS